MLLVRSNLFCHVKSATDHERRWLYDFLSFDDANARFRSGTNNKVRLFNLTADAYPAGLHSLVVDGARKQDITVNVVDKRQGTAVDHSVDTQWLRSYQRKAVQAAIAESNGIIWAPTGSGKTEIAAALALSIPTTWLFLVHRKTLVIQAGERYELRTGLPFLVYKRGVPYPWNDDGDPNAPRFVVTTFQTLYSGIKNQDPAAKKLLETAEGLIVDECHVLPAGSFYRVAMKTKRAQWRIGLSGTPLARGDRRSLMAVAALGPIIYRIKAEYLIEAGVLAKPKIRMIPVYQDLSTPTFQGVYGSGVVRSVQRNKVIVECAKRAKKPCLIFVKEIKHGKNILERLENAGIKAEFIWGSDNEATRMAAKKRLEFGDIEVLIASVVFQEGVDIPSLESVIIASGGKSVIAALQRIGRGMRTDQGRKTEFEVWDIMDQGNRWLMNHARARMKAYARETYEVVTGGL